MAAIDLEQGSMRGTDDQRVVDVQKSMGHPVETDTAYWLSPHASVGVDAGILAGVGDLGVSARNDDDGGENVGALWILFLNPNGTVKSHQKISALEGDFTGGLSEGDNFGQFGALLEDLDGDGVDDLVVVQCGEITLVTTTERAPDLKRLLEQLPSSVREPTTPGGSA